VTITDGAATALPTAPVTALLDVARTLDGAGGLVLSPPHAAVSRTNNDEATLRGAYTRINNLSNRGWGRLARIDEPVRAKLRTRMVNGGARERQVGARRKCAPLVTPRFKRTFIANRNPESRS
jgi:hypothetical protein